MNARTAAAILIPTVVHLSTIDTRDPDVLVIDRRSMWGNPFRMAHESQRAQVIDQYRAWLSSDPRAGPLRAAIRAGALSGKRLACHCAPKPCHGDVLRAMHDRHARVTQA